MSDYIASAWIIRRRAQKNCCRKFSCGTQEIEKEARCTRQGLNVHEMDIKQQKKNETYIHTQCTMYTQRT